MIEQIKKYFNRYIDFTEEEIEKFYGVLILENFPKNEFLLKEKEICRYKYFISKGILRSYFIDDKGNENILQFGIKNWWVTNFESFVLEKPSQLFIQALEETTVLKIDKIELEKLYISMPKLEKLFRIIAENMIIALQRKSEFYMKLSSKERYHSFIETNPDFAQKVPQYMIASYLEITPEYLSSIRKK